MNTMLGLQGGWAVGSGALLGCLLLVCILPLFYGSLKLWLQLPAPKPSLLELVKIYLNPRCALFAVRNGVKKLRGMLPRWQGISKARMILISRNIHSLDKTATTGKWYDKLTPLAWLNMLILVRRKPECVGEMRMPKVDTRLPYNQRGVLRPISNTYEDGSWITTYAYVEPESEPSRQSIQAHLVEIVKHSKNEGAHEQPNDPSSRTTEAKSMSDQNVTEQTEGAARGCVQRVVSLRLGELKYAGCKDHPERLDLSCAKIRKVTGEPLSNSDVWEVLQELANQKQANEKAEQPAGSAGGPQPKESNEK